MKQTCEGLARARELTRQGYDAQAAKTGTIYPRTVLKTITSTSPDYPMKYDPPRESVATALEIIGADDRAFREQLVFSLGKLNTCDANFAQQLLLLRQRIETHLAQPKPGVLSFAVFGGPGSGKSFVVSQVQESLGSDLAEKSVNVSQFADPEHLRRELVDVQALSLQDKIPFVLWDEFDCRYEDEQGGWLSKFLMPMQDGAFWDGGTRRALGKCVFVFVGGTWSSAGAFSNWVDTDPKAVLLKGRDFHSRLDRVLEIPSVDLRVGNKPALGCPLLNRAIFIRSKLRDLDAIDRNVAEFLLAARLRHGIRSLDTIIAASALRRTKRFTARQLPPPAVLGIHVVGHAVPTGPTDPLKINH